MKTKRIRLSEEKTILVVDDDSFVLKLIERILADAGLEDIKTASNGKEALEALGIFPTQTVDSSEIDLVVLDVLLPDTNGFEICKQIRGSNLDIPVILISGYDIEEIQNKLIECGADDFLKKPFSPAELSTRVKLMINREKKKMHDVAMMETSKLRFNMNHNVPFIGDNINGYIIVDSLGWGKYSLVYKVVKASDKNIYSLKMLSKSSLEKKDILERFKNEIEIISKIKHPNIVQFIDRGYFNDCPYLVMEYVDGVDLEEYLVTRGKISMKSFNHIAYDVASAISELHNQNIYHRDIKLKNILYEIKKGEAKLSDFGIAKLPDSLSTTQDGFIVGTPIYLAPEIFLGESATIQTDIYSYGATLYHLITGSPPFVAETSIELFKKHKLEKPPAVNTTRQDVPDEWNTLIVEKCLAKAPAARPASMLEIMEEIRKISQFQPVGS
ncbi:MAG: protein kinase [Victivallales bacterium]